MRFWQFLWDRINYIAVYVAFAALSLVVVHLDLMLTGGNCHPSGIVREFESLEDERAIEVDIDCRCVL